MAWNRGKVGLQIMWADCCVLSWLSFWTYSVDRIPASVGCAGLLEAGSGLAGSCAGALEQRKEVWGRIFGLGETVDA